MHCGVVDLLGGTHSTEWNSVLEWECVLVEPQPVPCLVNGCCAITDAQQLSFSSVPSFPPLSTSVVQHTELAAIAASSNPRKPNVFHLTLNRKMVNKIAIVEKAAASPIKLPAPEVAGACSRLYTHPIVYGGDMAWIRTSNAFHSTEGRTQNGQHVASTLDLNFANQASFILQKPPPHLVVRSTFMPYLRHHGCVRSTSRMGRHRYCTRSESMVQQTLN